jgi:ferredoxin-NADP reductase
MNITRCRIRKRYETAKNVFVLHLTPEAGTVFDFFSGQFVMLRILNPDGSLWRAKPYSVCTPPTEKGYIELAIKIYGPFTQRASTLKEGDIVELEGPHGVFLKDAQTPKDVAFLVGGIGITPFYSYIREATMKNLKQHITLLYANISKDDIAFFTEIQKLAETNPNFRVVFLVEQGEFPPPPAVTERGRVTLEILKKYCGAFASTEYFMCGPPIFMDVMTKILTEQGVPKERIKLEKF